MSDTPTPALIAKNVGEARAILASIEYRLTRPRRSARSLDFAVADLKRIDDLLPSASTLQELVAHA